ncbi:MAG: hypothetical protein ACKOFH_13835, partial [Chthoniobacterales bacterium]
MSARTEQGDMQGAPAVFIAVARPDIQTIGRFSGAQTPECGHAAQVRRLGIGGEKFLRRLRGRLGVFPGHQSEVSITELRRRIIRADLQKFLRDAQS